MADTDAAIRDDECADALDANMADDAIAEAKF